jgi:ketosteroid isomerase-like protein
MSQENVEIVRRLLGGFQARFERGHLGGGFDLGLVADDYEWVLAGEPFEGRSVWRGREGWVEFMRLWTEQFDDYSFQVVRVIDAGDDRVVALVRQSGTGKESGASVEWDNGVVIELKDGRLIRATNYLSHAEALEAVGLRE